MTTLFLSPHLDDAVLSCSALLQHERREHRRCIVATIFSAGEEEGYALRRGEDFEAVAVLDAEAVHLNLLDAPYRSAVFATFRQIITAADPLFPVTFSRVCEQLESLVSRYAPERIVAPLAVGNHIDHRIVRDAALALIQSEKILWYEDRPYSFLRALLLRAQDRYPGIVGDDRAVPHELLLELRESAFGKDFFGQNTLTELESWLLAVGPFPRAYDLAPDAIFIQSNAELCSTFRAIGRYRSQLEGLFGSTSQMERLYAERPERYYRLLRPATAPHVP